MPASIRVLALGNEILADDAFGLLVGAEIEKLYPAEQVEVVRSPESGLHLLDYLQGVARLIVVDTLQTGSAAPGTLFALREGDLTPAAGGTPHCTGLFDALALARSLGLAIPEDVLIVAVEPADCLTVGGAMHPAVAAAIPRAVELIGQTR